MSNVLPAFFAQAPRIALRDPLAQFLGAAGDGGLQYSYADAVKLTGHSCPAVAGVIASVAGLITGAATEGGFKGIAGRFARGGLLGFGAAIASDLWFTRLDSGRAVEVNLPRRSNHGWLDAPQYAFPGKEQGICLERRTAMKLSGIAGLALVLAAVLVSAPSSAQQAKTVADVTIRLGLVSALEAEHVDAQHGMHKGGHGSGMEHLVVSLADPATGSYIANADVVVEVRDPKGKVQSKSLRGMITAGFPDYSEVFDFGWSGKYTIRVTILRQGVAGPLKASFIHNHVI